MENVNLLQKINDKMESLSKGQKLISKYILEHYDKAAFMTASKLGDVVNVSESTVVRFAVEMGYEGYPELQKALQEIIKNKLTSVQRMELATTKIGDQNILKNILQSDLENLKAAIDEIDENVFAKAVEEIVNAENVYILGARSCYSLANFLGFYLNLICRNVKTVNTNSASETLEQIYRIDKNDVIIGISFPRYSSHTIDALSFAAKKGSTIIAITDSALSPITKMATYSLVARSNMSYFVDSLVAPLSVINALIVAIVMRKKTEVSETFEQLESLWDTYKVYESKIENIIKDGE